jgi:hypothetical protein
MIHGAKPVYRDKLVAQFKLPNGKLVRQGLRVPKDCPLTKEERRIYIKLGAVKLVKALMKGRGLSLQESVDLLEASR